MERIASCRDVAKYFLTLNDEEVGELISNLKLQKLVYYAQGFSLAIDGRPLFSDSIEAWAHGPVVPALYRDYKHYEGGPIPRPDDFDPSCIDPDTKDLLNEIYSVFGQFSAWKLRNMTHEEPPWKDAWETNDRIISEESMKEYFKTLLVNDD
jgi:uncharacterized phage-associated protein